jgi:hypothetical protein
VAPSTHGTPKADIYGASLAVALHTDAEIAHFQARFEVEIHRRVHEHHGHGFGSP